MLNLTIESLAFLTALCTSFPMVPSGNLERYSIANSRPTLDVVAVLEDEDGVAVLGDEDGVAVLELHDVRALVVHDVRALVVHDVRALVVHDVRALVVHDLREVQGLAVLGVRKAGLVAGLKLAKGLLAAVILLSIACTEVLFPAVR
jgi:hypothetical protein